MLQDYLENIHYSELSVRLHRAVVQYHISITPENVI